MISIAIVEETNPGRVANFGKLTRFVVINAGSRMGSDLLRVAGRLELNFMAILNVSTSLEKLGSRKLLPRSLSLQIS